MSLQIECIEAGALGANCYIISDSDTGMAAIIDPGGDADILLLGVEQLGVEVKYIINTHSHPDHVAANEQLQHALQQGQGLAPRLLIHETERADVENPPLQWRITGLELNTCKVDDTLAEGDELPLGNLTIRVMHTPGHSPGSIALVVGEVVFTGDTLFAGGIGRTDLPGGNTRKIENSLKRLVTELPRQMPIYPGHGPDSTIGEERDSNPWINDMNIV